MEGPPDELRCDTTNRFNAGGNGDFSVIFDPVDGYFYFFISTYYADPSQQGVSIARMAYKDRNQPVGKVKKWQNGQWHQPGLGGTVTPIFPAAVDWDQDNTDAFWGPAVSWNTYLKQYVMTLNRAQNNRYGQEGMYVAFNRDISNPQGWSTPVKIMEGNGLGEGAWYPEIVGLEAGGTDKLAGRGARLFVYGTSNHEIVFTQPGFPALNVDPNAVVRPVLGAEKIRYTFRLQSGVPDISWGVHLVSGPGFSGDFLLPESTDLAFWANGAFSHEYELPFDAATGAYTFAAKDVRGNYARATVAVH